jgi:hypothetical protein
LLSSENVAGGDQYDLQNDALCHLGEHNMQHTRLSHEGRTLANHVSSFARFYEMLYDDREYFV